MRGAREKRLEFEFLGAQHATDHVAVGIGQVDHAELALHMGDVLDDLVRLLLAQGEFVPGGVERADHVHEGVHGEGVVLARDGEARHGPGVALVALFEEVGLLEHLAGVAEERLALRDAHFALQVAYGGGHARLRHEEPPRRLGHAAA